MAGIETLMQMMKLSESLEDDERGKPLNQEGSLKLASQEEAMKKLQRLIELKTKGFGGKGIDTGPIAGRIPEAASALAADLEGLPLESQGDRAQLNQLTLHLLNPIRKETTGSGAAVSELKDYILPTLPTPKDNDPVWLNRAFQSVQDLGGQRQSAIKELMNQGYRVPQFNYDAYIEDMRKQIYGR